MSEEEIQDAVKTLEKIRLLIEDYGLSQKESLKMITPAPSLVRGGCEGSCAKECVTCSQSCSNGPTR